MAGPWLSIEGIARRYGGRPVFRDVWFGVERGEFVALIGHSGCGKTTILNILAGLEAPDDGTIVVDGREVSGPALDRAVIFQSHALLPWLTALGNVVFAVRSRHRGWARSKVQDHARQVLALVGLTEAADRKPAELSGGMKQRVGIARALAIEPSLLLMDEPFSALDVLTAETLRTDLIDLWIDGKLPIKSILMVTHNIEEAVLMCDRVLVFSSNPGRVANELHVPFPHPRNRLDPAFRQMVDDIYALMTRRAPIAGQKSTLPTATVGTALHPVSTNLLSGLMETLVAPPYEGRADLPALAEGLQLEADELLPMGEALQLLGFGDLDEGDLRVTEMGREFVAADIDSRKALFGAALRAHVPLAAQIRQVLDERWNHRASAVRFRDELEDVMSAEYADATMRAVIAWGRYAELYSYDEDADQFSLD